MKLNMGSIDRILRVLVAALFGWVYFSGTITGVWGLVLVIVGGVFLLTSIIGFCPLYAVFGLRTKAKKIETK
jgi:Protein of unknown function (DUF2892)